MSMEILIIIGILGVILCLSIMGLLIYSLIEFIHLSHVAIEALTIYIENNEKDKVR